MSRESMSDNIHIIYEIIDKKQNDVEVTVYIIGVLPNSDFEKIEKFSKMGKFKETIPCIYKKFFEMEYMEYGVITMSKENAKLFEEDKDLNSIRIKRN